MVMLIEYGGGSGGSDFSLDIDDTNLPSRREALAELGQPAAGVHRRAKHVPPNVVAQALNNEPFEDYSRAVYSWKRMCNEGGEAKEKSTQSYNQMVESFLRRVFHGLTFIPGISFGIKGAADKDERNSLDAALARYRALNMGGQIDSLNMAYDGLRALRTVFGHVSRNSCFNMETVVPARYLPELLVAAPVWFVETKAEHSHKPEGSSSHIVRYFCDLGATDRFAHLFQMYNLRPRSFYEFEGRDVMPLPIMELVSQVRDAFDFLVIATPYHDIAGKEWYARWVRNIDPFLFGFLEQVPELMFFLGRWSGTGLFPLIGDMIADTIEHIRINKMLLSNFSEKTDWYWTEHMSTDAAHVIGPALMPVADYLPSETGYSGNVEQWRNENHSLVKFADKVLEQFEKGSLFPWLRGET